MIFEYFEGGMARFNAIFDRVTRVDNVVLSLVNEFNCQNGFLQAHISEKGFLIVSNVTAFYDESMLGRYTTEFMSRVSDLSNDATLKRLTNITVE